MLWLDIKEVITLANTEMAYVKNRIQKLEKDFAAFASFNTRVPRPDAVVAVHWRCAAGTTGLSGTGKISAVGAADWLAGACAQAGSAAAMRERERAIRPMPEAIVLMLVFLMRRAASCQHRKQPIRADLPPAAS